MNQWYAQEFGYISSEFIGLNNPIPQGQRLYNPIYTIFLKQQNYRNGEKVTVIAVS